MICLVIHENKVLNMQFVKFAASFFTRQPFPWPVSTMNRIWNSITIVLILPKMWKDSLHLFVV